MKFTIWIPEKVSLNKIYAGIHFRQRSSHKDDYYNAVLCAKIAPYEGEYPVAVSYHFKLKGTPLDVSNYAYMVKMVEDALVAHGVLIEDDPKYIQSITVTAEKIGKEEEDVVDVTVIPFRPIAKKK